MANILQGTPAPGIIRRPGTKITLRRCISKETIVKRNLDHMQLRSAKKRIAQALYYGTQEYLSPIKRVSVDDMKMPVHQRLGGKKLTLRRQVNIAGTHTSSIPPKMRLGLKRLQHGRSKFTVQPRLLKYRLSPTNPATTLSITTQKQRLKLYRNMRNQQQNIPKTPMNFVVEVKNQNATNFSGMHSLRSSLNQELQQEIKAIQMETTAPNQIVGNLPVLVIAAGPKINDRFSALP